tara:strand:- start:479 stop:1186 length:708 start_codon:yes stop_codon:yes gene_type:complete
MLKASSVRFLIKDKFWMFTKQSDKPFSAYANRCGTFKMKTYVLTILLFGTFNFCFSQEEIEVLPGQGIIIDSDTILLAIDRPNTVFSKIDTSSYPISIQTGIGIADGLVVEIDSTNSGNSNSKDTSWTTHHFWLTWRNSVIFEFEGTQADTLPLTKIIVLEPLSARTSSGLKIGDDLQKIFEDFQEIEGSYNCGEKGFHYCYYDHGISFQAKTINKGSNQELEIITGFEIYEIGK